MNFYQNANMSAGFVVLFAFVDGLRKIFDSLQFTTQDNAFIMFHDLYSFLIDLWPALFWLSFQVSFRMMIIFEDHEHFRFTPKINAEGKAEEISSARRFREFVFFSIYSVLAFAALASFESIFASVVIFLFSLIVGGAWIRSSWRPTAEIAARSKCLANINVAYFFGVLLFLYQSVYDKDRLAFSAIALSILVVFDIYYLKLPQYMPDHRDR